VVGIFPAEKSLIRLIGLVEQDDESENQQTIVGSELIGVGPAEVRNVRREP
jgi:hypothetical protein